MESSQRQRIEEKIVAALQLFEVDRMQSMAMLRGHVADLDDHDCGVLLGISGVLCHAVESRTPRRWIVQIHDDLMDALSALTTKREMQRASEQN